MPAAADASALAGYAPAAIAIAAALLLGTYLLLGSTTLFRRRALYALLRIAALALLAFALFGPERTSESKVEPRHALAVIIDNSKSLRFPLSANTPRTRLDALASLLRARAADFDALARRYDLAVYYFDRELARRSGASGPVEPPAADGGATALGGALLGALDRARGKRLAGVLVISDGRSNLGVSTREAARELDRARVPVHALALGDGQPVADLAIIALDVPGEVSIGKPVRARVSVRARAVRAATTRIVLRAGEREIERRRLRLRAGDSGGEVSFEFTPSEPGTLVVEATVEPLPGEFVRANNRRLAFIEIRDTTLRVIYAEGVLRQDYRAIRRSLGAASGIDLDLARAFLKRGASEPGKAFGERPGELSRVRWGEYDVLVLGEFPKGSMPRATVEIIKNLVAERGRGLVVLSGPVALSTSFVPALLPVRITDFRPAPSESRIAR